MRPLVVAVSLLVAATALAVPALAGDDGPRPATRPATQEQLVERALTALASGNGDAYVKLLPTLADMERYCPKELDKGDGARERMDKELARMHAKVREKVAACHQAFDWKRAKQVAIEGGDKRKTVKSCLAVEQIDDIEVLYEVDGKRYRVKLDDPFVLDGKIFGFSDDPRCRAADPPPAPGPQPHTKPAP